MREAQAEVDLSCRITWFSGNYCMTTARCRLFDKRLLPVTYSIKRSILHATRMTILRRWTSHDYTLYKILLVLLQKLATCFIMVRYTAQRGRSPIFRDTLYY